MREKERKRKLGGKKRMKITKGIRGKKDRERKKRKAKERDQEEDKESSKKKRENLQRRKKEREKKNVILSSFKHFSKTTSHEKV